MSKKILVVGKSGSGKSSSLYKLDEQKTIIFKCLNKELPFRQGDKRFKNFIVDDSNMLLTYLRQIEKSSKVKPEVIVIDDFIYLQTKEMMAKAKEKGYDKWMELAKNVWDVITEIDSYQREDLTVIFMTHSETNEHTMETDVRTLGRMLKEKVNLAGMFTIVLEATIEGGEYLFATHNVEGNSIVKTPRDMFDEDYIPNDMAEVLKTIKAYYEG